MWASTMRLRTALPLSALLATAALACSSVASPGSQEADHTAGEPTFAQYPWLWADETEDEMRGIREDRFLPSDHAMAQRLQFWVDAMDAVLRERHPEALAHTPKPRILVADDETPNAWVSYMPVAWKVPTRLSAASARDAGLAPKDPAPVEAGPGSTDGGDEAGAGTDAGEVAAAPEPKRARELLVTNRGTVDEPYAIPLEREHTPAQLEELVGFLNRGFSSCRVQVEDGTVVLGEACAVDASVRADRSDRLAFYATGKWITVTTGLVLKLLDEDRIVSVLAHELGHYYRSHSMMPSDALNYFYELGDRNEARKPSPDPRYLAQTLAVREKVRSPSYYTSYADENALMVEQRLGFYTTEQEADDLSLELLAAIGLPPSLAGEAELALHRIASQSWWAGSGGEDELGWEACSTLRDQGFRDEAGQWVSVPVGDVSRPHHSHCFRAFNVTREIAAHRYELGERPRLPYGEDWSQLVARLGVEIDPPPPPKDAGADAEAGPVSEAGAGSDASADGATDGGAP